MARPCDSAFQSKFGILLLIRGGGESAIAIKTLSALDSGMASREAGRPVSFTRFLIRLRREPTPAKPRVSPRQSCIGLPDSRDVPDKIAGSLRWCKLRYNGGMANWKDTR